MTENILHKNEHEVSRLSYKNKMTKKTMLDIDKHDVARLCDEFIKKLTINYSDKELQKLKFTFTNIIKNFDSCKFISNKWVLSEKVFFDIIQKSLTWKPQHRVRNPVDFKDKKTSLLKILVHRIVEELKKKSNKSTNKTKKFVIEDRLNLENLDMVKYYKKNRDGTGNYFWKTDFVKKIEELKDEGKIKDVKEYLNNYDPQKRFVRKEISTNEHIRNWFKPNGGNKIEIAWAFFNQNKVKCKICNYKGFIKWCGGSGGEWSDCICSNCNAYYEIKSKRSDFDIEKLIVKKEIDGGAYLYFLDQEYKKVKHNLILVSRETGHVWYQRLNTNNVSLRFTRETVCFSTRPLKSRIKLDNIERWKEADINLNKIPNQNCMEKLSKTILDKNFIVIKIQKFIRKCLKKKKINRSTVVLQKNIRIWLSKKRQNQNNEKCLLLLPDGRFVSSC